MDVNEQCNISDPHRVDVVDLDMTIETDDGPTTTKQFLLKAKPESRSKDGLGSCSSFNALNSLCQTIGKLSENNDEPNKEGQLGTIRLNEKCNDYRPTDGKTSSLTKKPEEAPLRSLLSTVSPSSTSKGTTSVVVYPYASGQSQRVPIWPKQSQIASPSTPTIVVSTAPVSLVPQNASVIAGSSLMGNPFVPARMQYPLLYALVQEGQNDVLAPNQNGLINNKMFLVPLNGLNDIAQLGNINDREKQHSSQFVLKEVRNDPVISGVAKKFVVSLAAAHISSDHPVSPQWNGNQLVSSLVPTERHGTSPNADATHSFNIPWHIVQTGASGAKEAPREIDNPICISDDDEYEVPILHSQKPPNKGVEVKSTEAPQSIRMLKKPKKRIHDESEEDDPEMKRKKFSHDNVLGSCLTNRNLNHSSTAGSIQKDSIQPQRPSADTQEMQQTDNQTSLNPPESGLQAFETNPVKVINDCVPSDLDIVKSNLDFKIEPRTICSVAKTKSIDSDGSDIRKDCSPSIEVDNGTENFLKIKQESIHSLAEHEIKAQSGIESELKTVADCSVGPSQSEIMNNLPAKDSRQHSSASQNTENFLKIKPESICSLQELEIEAHSGLESESTTEADFKVRPSQSELMQNLQEEDVNSGQHSSASQNQCNQRTGDFYHFNAKQLPKCNVLRDSVVRKAIQDYYMNKRIPTSEGIYRACCDSGLQLPKVSIKPYLKSIGYNWVQCGRNKLLMEDYQITAERMKYLNKLKKYQGKNLVYIFVSGNVKKVGKAWRITSDHVEKRYLDSARVVLHAMSNKRFLSGGLKVVKGMKHNKVIYWLKCHIIPQIPKESVVILGNRLVFEKKEETEARPTVVWSKEEIISWLKTHKVPSVNPNLPKAYLLRKVKNVILPKTSAFDRLILQNGSIPIHLPKHHSDLSPVEFIWQDIVDKLHASPKIDNLSLLEKFITREFSAASEMETSVACDLVQSFENSYREFDMLSDELFEKLIAKNKRK